ncbi:MAG TPA: hypothetical protein VFV33_17680, partial [Gemmatimonadaceae bacterium]|nr:hypothetical protein [Gemmatimonadaceae bacterium]
MTTSAPPTPTGATTPPAAAPHAPPAHGAHSPLAQLTLARFREFLREPEAVFWSFVFPILLASGLGIAFRTRPAEVAKVAVLASAPGAEALRTALARDASLAVETLDDTAAATALRIG